MTNTHNRKPKWFFYPGWVVLSAISFPIALAIYWVLISQINKAVGSTIQVGGQPRITEDFLLPGIATSVTLWLLLDRLPYGKVKGKDTPPTYRRTRQLERRKVCH